MKRPWPPSGKGSEKYPLDRKSDIWSSSHCWEMGLAFHFVLIRMKELLGMEG